MGKGHKLLKAEIDNIDLLAGRNGPMEKPLKHDKIQLDLHLKTI